MGSRRSMNILASVRSAMLCRPMSFLKSYAVKPVHLQFGWVCTFMSNYHGLFCRPVTNIVCKMSAKAFNILSGTYNIEYCRRYPLREKPRTQVPPCKLLRAHLLSRCKPNKVVGLRTTTLPASYSDRRTVSSTSKFGIWRQISQLGRRHLSDR
jgi:hypothetical protein